MMTILHPTKVVATLPNDNIKIRLPDNTVLIDAEPLNAFNDKNRSSVIEMLPAEFKPHDGLMVARKIYADAIQPDHPLHAIPEFNARNPFIFRAYTGNNAHAQPLDGQPHGKEGTYLLRLDYKNDLEGQLDYVIHAWLPQPDTGEASGTGRPPSGQTG